MRQVADVTERVPARLEQFPIDPPPHRERVRVRILHAFPAKVNRVGATLIIRFDQERLCFAFLSRVVLAPDKGVRPVGIVAERQIVNRRGSRAMDFGFGMEFFGTLDVKLRNL